MLKVHMYYIPAYLKDFDLAASRVQMFRILSCFIFFECVNLDAKWHSLLTTMFAHCKLCADAMDLKTDKQLFTTTTHAVIVLLSSINATRKLDTWMNTEVRFDGSHRNSTVLSCVGFALGSTIPTDIGMSEKNFNRSI